MLKIVIFICLYDCDYTTVITTLKFELFMIFTQLNLFFFFLQASILLFNYVMIPVLQWFTELIFRKYIPFFFTGKHKR